MHGIDNQYVAAETFSAAIFVNHNREIDRDCNQHHSEADHINLRSYRMMEAKDSLFAEIECDYEQHCRDAQREKSFVFFVAVGVVFVFWLRAVINADKADDV